jgi:hypothetical protein
MKTARSTYYAWVAGAEAREARRRADEALAHQVAVIHIASRRNYGVPRVTAELRRQGRPVNRKRVARVMREHRIAGNSRRTGRRSLTKADTKAAPSPDLIGRDFTATRPGTKIGGDITYIEASRDRLCWPFHGDVSERRRASRREVQLPAWGSGEPGVDAGEDLAQCVALPDRQRALRERRPRDPLGHHRNIKTEPGPQRHHGSPLGSPRTST